MLQYGDDDDDDDDDASLPVLLHVVSVDGGTKAWDTGTSRRAAKAAARQRPGMVEEAELVCIVRRWCSFFWRGWEMDRG